MRVVVETPQGTVGGSGFRFSGTRVVTARSLVHGADSIRIFDPEYGGWLDSGPLDAEKEQGVLWPPAEEQAWSDVAVLATPEIPDLEPFALQTSPWESPLRWACAGFAGGAADGLWTSHGEAVLFEEASLELPSKDPDRLAEEAPAGLRGAPLFVWPSETGVSFAGVVGLGFTGGGHLSAVPLASLFDRKHFQHVLHAGEPEWFEKYVNQIFAKINGNRELTELVRESLSLERERVTQPKDVARAACTFGSGEFTLRLSKAAAAWDQAGKLEQARQVREVLTAVAPVRFLRTRGLAPPDLRSGPVDLPVNSDLAVEAHVAVGHGRAMELEAMAGDVLRARNRVVDPMVFGIDPSGTAALDDVIDELRQLIVLASGPDRAARAFTAELARLYKCCPRMLRDQIQERTASEDVWRKVVSQAINGRLALIPDWEKKYLLLALNQEADSRKDFIDALKEYLPDLLLVTRSGTDNDEWAAEDKELQIPLTHAFKAVPTSKKDDM
ncbi:MAG: hypothetical protein AAGM22_31935 [Acidobacteriota bacterium]